MKRVSTPELLDDDLGTPEEVTASLRDLRHVNALFGGTRTTTALLRKIARESGLTALSLLEVGGGGGDVPASTQRALARQGIPLRVTLLDRMASHLPRNGTPAVGAEALRLPFPDNAFDIVGSNLFLHHFDPERLVQLTAEALRVARVAVLVNDLIRSPIHLLLTYLGMPLFRSRLTWHDAPASVRQAYTLHEMRGLLAQTGARRIDASRHYLYRMGIVLWK